MFIKYVETTILNQVKEKIVYALANQVIHLGDTTTNLVEYAHGILKTYLLDSKSGFYNA